MWKIKELKNRARKTLKNNPWTLIIVGIFMTIVIGEYAINKDSFSNLKITYEYVKDKNIQEIIETIDKEEIANKYLDKVMSQMFTGNVTSFINKYNEENNITKGVIFTAFNVITKGQTQIQNLVNSIATYENKETLASIILIMSSAFGILIKVFIAYPIRIGESRVYLESINYKRTKVRRLIYSFKKERYFSSVKAMLLMEVYKLLWNFTIIGGIIKNYSYKMVTYIIAENPSINAKDAIKISREMMQGNKFKAFKLDLSFIGWNILEYITFGVAGIYVTPYYTATYAELYSLLRKDYIENEKYKYELLNDEKLFETNNLDKYPDIYEIERKKIKINYNKKYELISIILFFFIFSFVGWVWEVALYLFRDGILVNRGTLYGPWLPIYGVGCTIIILLTKFKAFREMLKNPFITFLVVMMLCTVIEYFASWYIEMTLGVRYWDYTGVFFNINGRVCLECSVFFGLGSCLCVYIVAPFLERRLQKLKTEVKILVSILLVLLFSMDNIYSKIYPRTGEGITTEVRHFQ